MQHRIALSSCAFAAALAVGSTGAFAQLVVGNTSPTTSNPAAVFVDLSSGQQTTMWNSAANKKVNGIAADNTNGKIYANDAARLNFWNMNPGALGGAPTFIDGTYRTNDNVTFAATGNDGMTFANNTLYATTSFASSTFKRGIYSVSTIPDAGAHCVMTPVWVDTSAGGGSTVLGDLDFNSSNGLFYVVSSFDTTSIGGVFGFGVYSIDATNNVVAKVADFPTGRTKIDGFTFGGGKWWLSEDDETNNRIDIYPYDPNTETYGDTIFVPLLDATHRATDLTWAPNAIPEPSMLGLMGVATLAAVRRRKR